jgi:hypothetical protein
MLNPLRNKPGVDRAQAAATKTWLSVSTGHKVDFDRLEPDEQEELVRLARKLATERGGIAWGQLGSREKKTAERLLEKGAGHEPGPLRSTATSRPAGCSSSRRSRRGPQAKPAHRPASAGLFRDHA